MCEFDNLLWLRPEELLNKVSTQGELSFVGQISEENLKRRKIKSVIVHFLQCHKKFRKRNACRRETLRIVDGDLFTHTIV